MGSKLQTFEWPEYVVMFVVILISLGIGLYHGFTGDKQKKSSEYFLGNRQLWMVPVALSVVATSISPNTVLGIPAEVYWFGSTYVWIAVSGLISFAVTAIFILPLLYPLEITSIYEYFELRYPGIFGKLLRMYTMILQVLTQLALVATIVFGPAMALEVATGVPVVWCIIIIPAVGIVYTALGGIKGVVYADAFQCVIMFVGMLLTIGVGLTKFDDISHVWDISWDWGRIKPEDEFDPTARATLYSIMIGGFFTGLAGFGTNQAVIQRALGTKSLARAQCSYIISGPLSLVTQVIAVALGLVIFAYYAREGCDPLINKDISSPDQVMPLFLVTVVDYPTVGGFFYASVICASLSTISSSINSVTAVIWDDVLILFLGKFSEFTQSVARRVVALVYGLSIIGAALILERFKEDQTLISVAYSVYGALQGPVLGMFLFAALLPFSNGIGAMIGGICAAGVTLWMMFSRIDLNLSSTTLPPPIETCVFPTQNATTVVPESTTVAQFFAANVELRPAAPEAFLNETSTTTSITTTTEAMLSSIDTRTDLEWFYSISFWYYAVIAVLVVFLVGTLVSLITWCCTSRDTQKKYLFPIVRNFAGIEDEPEKSLKS